MMPGESGVAVVAGLSDHLPVELRRRLRGWLAMATVVGSSMAATNAGAVAVLVPETPIAAAQYAPVSGSLPTTAGFACNTNGCLAAGDRALLHALDVVRVGRN